MLPPCPKCGGHQTRFSNGKLHCPPCKKKRDLEHYYNNKQRILNKKKNQYEENREDILTKKQIYRNNNRESTRSKARSWRENNRDKVFAYRQKEKEDRHPIKPVYVSMIQRCYTESSRSYDRYGGRGIRVCDRWLGKDGFKNFLEDMGPRPQGTYENGFPIYSIDRVENNGNYEPGNCRWTTMMKQASNRNSNISYRTSRPDNSPIYYEDKLITLSEFSEKTGLPLIICKYRYAQCPGKSEWILNNDSETDNRYYEYEGYRYNMTELSVLSGFPFHIIHNRVRQMKWSVDKTIQTPIQYKSTKRFTGRK